MWSRLEGTELWGKAQSQYATPSGREYHNFDHVLRLYEIADQLNFDYCPHLDKAILAHDVIYDNQKYKELRSAHWLRENDPEHDDEEWNLITTTANHYPTRDNRLLILDLYDLQDPVLFAENRKKIANEMRALYGIEEDAFLVGNEAFLKDLSQRLTFLPDDVSEFDKNAIEEISQGINQNLSALTDENRVEP